MEQKQIALTAISFKSATPGTYNKTFRKDLNNIKSNGYPENETKDFLKKYVSENSITKINKRIDNNTILASMPFAEDNKQNNTIPSLYVKSLSERTGNPYIDLSDYLKVRQIQSENNNYFNIGFKDMESAHEIKSKLSGKSILLIDDVITSGKNMVNLATYLNIEIPNLQIKGGHGLAASDSQIPTNREIEHVSQKFSEKLDPKISQEKLRKLMDFSLSSYTRANLTAIERKTVTTHTAKHQYQNLQKHNNQLQTSLKESFAGNLIRYPLDSEEIKKLNNTNPLDLSTNFSLRGLLHHYPKATFTKDEKGQIHLYSDKSKTKILSMDKKPFFDESKAIQSAISLIQHNAKELNQNNNKTTGLSL